MFAALITFIALSRAIAAAPSWTLDQAHSNVTFSIHHMVISEVTGSFKDFAVNLHSAKEDFTDANIDATVNVNSINTENDRRDAHLRTDDFFNAEKFPTIKFKSTSFEKIGENHYAIKGLLTIRDTTKEVTIDAVLNGILSSSKGERAGWKGTLSINRFDYGLKWNQTIETGGLIAGATVNIIFNFEFVKG
jgi:polyisoprenoid-binding protein YceI